MDGDSATQRENRLLLLADAPGWDAHRQPFYFFMVFWGAEHRGYFTDLCLASLLSPGNIPALDPRRSSRFLICTTRVDWEALQEHPLFHRLKNYVEPVWIEMQAPGSAASKMLVMSKGHKAMSTMAYRDGALGVFLTADMVIADGMVRRLQELALEGRRVVLVLAMRYAHEGFMQELSERSLHRQGEALNLSPRTLAGLAVRHLHSETVHYDFDAPWFGNYLPVCPFWRVPGEDGILLHGFSWAAMLMSYAHLKRHDTETFENWTVDGDYVHRNFPDAHDVYVVTDSDEMMLVGLTKESDLHYVCEPNPVLDVPFVGYHTRVQVITRAKHSDIMDPLKREIFDLPVRIHEHELTSVWDKVEKRARKVVNRTKLPPSTPDMRKVERWREAVRMYHELAPGAATHRLDVETKRTWMRGWHRFMSAYRLLAVLAIDAFRRYRMMTRIGIGLVRWGLVYGVYRSGRFRGNLRFLLSVLGMYCRYTPLFLSRELAARVGARLAARSALSGRDEGSR